MVGCVLIQLNKTQKNMQKAGVYSKIAEYKNYCSGREKPKKNSEWLHLYYTIDKEKANTLQKILEQWLPLAK